MIQNSLIAAASFTPNSLQFPNAWAGHLPFAAWVIQEISPKIFVELGTHSGNSYFAFCQSVVEAGTSTKCYAVDTWQGDEHAGQYNDEIFAKVNAHHQEHYAGFSRLLRITFDDATTYFANESIELLHIDGLHTYEAVRHDFETWLPKLAPGAVVMFHDTNVRERNFGVWKLWEELQARYPNNLEFVHSHGLGVLQLNNAPDDKRVEWLQPNSPEKQRLKNFFAALGSRQLERFELSELKRHTSNLNQAVAERNGQIANLNQTVAERDGQIANLNQTVVERDGQIAKLNQTVAKRDGQITNLNQAVAERDGQIAHLNQAVAERDGQIANLNQAVAARDGQLAALYNSTSWRMMRPLRIVAHQMKRVRRVAELVMPAIKRGGGLKNTVKKAIRLYRREGIAGIRRGFRIVATSGQLNSAPNSGKYDRNDYDEWIRRYDTLTDTTRATMRARIDAFPHKPLISVVMPTYNPKTAWLIEVIESVRKQIYPHWELCIADDASTDKAIRPILERYAREDSRIKAVFREQNGHISAASNSALEQATGEWVALLDHDDLLSEHALFWVADAINQHPDVRLIYSDEDKIDEAGRRFDPYFKCDWNVDLFYSHNLITHLGVYRADLLTDIGGFREGLEGAQDYDLALRCIECIEPKQIHHIPRVLYHWRMHVGSTAQSADAKPYAMLAGERALNEHFQRQKINALAELASHGYRVRYALPDTPPMVSLIIPTRNGLQLIQQCVGSILKKTTYPNYEILIVDNGSDDPATLQYLDELKAEARVRVIRDDRPFNYSALNNVAVRFARGELVGLLNNDLEVISPEWLSEMASIALQPGVGAVGAKLWYPNNTLQHGGVILGIGGWAGHAHKGFPKGHPGYVGRMSLISGFTAITGACLIVRKGLYEKVGGLNESDLQIACNDVDFCLNLREEGSRNVWTPYAELYHHESATRGYEDTPVKQARFAKELQYMRQRWGEQLLNDPAYSPNLTLDHEDFSLAWPPRVEAVLSPQDTHKTVLNRIDKALIMVDRNGLGLEIGPSHNPLAPKKQGFNVHILDHASADELRAKYQGHGLNLENIEEVDYVWHGEPLHELVGRKHCYDWIIASHVIEHTPDLITFLQECERLLKSNGVLSLVIPDKRYCFDYFNPTTSTGELLDAFGQKRKRPSPGKVFDHFAGAAKRNGHIAWGQGDAGVIDLVHSFGEARAHWGMATTSSDYIDVHNWRFTPSSFRLILSDLQALGLTGLGLAKEFDTEGCEFFVTLRKTSATVAPDRLELLNRVRVDG